MDLESEGECAADENSEAEPLISCGDGLRAILDLDAFLSQKWPGEYEHLHSELQKLRRTVRREIQHSATQTDIRTFFQKK